MGNGFASNRSMRNLYSFMHDLYDIRALLMSYGVTVGNVWYVDPVNGSNVRAGTDPGTGLLTYAEAVDRAAAGDLIVGLPGFSDEPAEVVVTGDKSNLTFLGLGGRGSVGIEPSTAGQKGMSVRADDVTLINFGVAAGDNSASSYALRVYGSRFRAFACKFENAVNAVVVSPGTVVQHAASGSSYYGNAGDDNFYDCEFAWSDNGIDFTSSDYGAATEQQLVDCVFHDIATDIVKDTDAGGTTGGVQGLMMRGCLLANAEDATAPTNYVNIGANSTGVITFNFLATAAAALPAKSAYPAGVLWVANATEGGFSAARP